MSGGGCGIQFSSPEEFEANISKKSSNLKAPTQEWLSSEDSKCQRAAWESIAKVGARLVVANQVSLWR